MRASFDKFLKMMLNAIVNKSYYLIPANNNQKSRLRARKYSKCMKTWHEASTSGLCSRELKLESGLLS